jgi:quinoprotein glucose dehydrogenase
MASQAKRGGRWRRALKITAGIIVIGLIVPFLVIRALQFHPPQDGRSWDMRPPAAVADNLDWKAVGGDIGQARYSPIAQITDKNVGRLEVAWTYRTGEMVRHAKSMAWTKFEATPIIADNKLVFCTPFNRVVALDPATGKEIWVFDAEIDASQKPVNNLGCRGLARWVDKTAPAGALCAERLFMATNDLRMIALDARTGALCPGWGANGETQVIARSDEHDPVEVHINMAPAVVGDVVVIGSSIADSQWLAAARGTVHAYDARTGKLRWTFDPFPSPGNKTGAANVWSAISADPERDLVFLPTTSPSPDFFGGERVGDDSFESAMVAIKASTGKVAWVFQTTHHDLWDYDVPDAPAMFMLNRGGQKIPALAFTTKSAFLYVLNRETGKPLYPVIEKPVPQSDVPGEHTSPTQPFSTLPTLSPQSFNVKDAFGLTPIDRAICRGKFKGIRNEGIFTPPSLRGSILYPATAGGGEWGGVAIDPTTNRLIVNTNNFVEIMKLIPRAQYDRLKVKPRMMAPQRGTAFAAETVLAFSPIGVPCSPPPYGAISAIDLDTGKLAWRKPLGTTSDQAPFGIAFKWGSINFGGPLLTGGGLAFVAATTDNRLRAFRVKDGEELWAFDLPASAQAAPMTYAIGGRQYIVLAAGGHGMLGTKKGDYVIAYALPK